ncbi:transglycosylase SLT domain-containing protein [Sphingomonas sp. BIUV-7]|uniref:Transglycosylase SLT domain-containing protein n=1 Tax=Sphingomonas natans TaxID=3063330 RepID=A0ABT8YDX1_9SPHN|nr:transglycosylase SLT domain-containing protein [Sphingomonas sp. BIUV-7]MDO6416542.1 transglycosylase SLT domain-containing protein [Sphingomonas sp. BIUV-7]
MRSAIGAAAQRTGVDFSYLLAQAKSESGLNPGAKASGSSATGLYQFLDQSWLGIVKKHGTEHGYGWAADAISAKAGGGFTVAPQYRQAVMALREQAGPASMMAASYASDNAQSLGRSIGREANSTDLYMCHFLGLGGATRFLQACNAAPNASAASVFPREAQSNRGIFYERDGSPRSLSEVYSLMGSKLAKNGADTDGDALSGASDFSVQAGDLVSAPPSTGINGFRLAVDDTVATDATATGEVSQTLAALEQGRMNVLRPTPAQARLAYLMLSMPTV